MTYIILNDENVAVSTVNYFSEVLDRNYVDCSDSLNVADAEVYAAQLTDSNNSLYIAIDNGQYTYPRYDIIQAPKVGVEVSKAFNGDYYPCGEIVSVSKSLKVVTTSDGTKFYRRGQTAKWLNNRTFALIQGTVSRLNPEF